MNHLLGVVAISVTSLFAGRLEGAVASSVYYLERSRQAEGLEDFSVRLSVTIHESLLAQGAASTAVLEDPRGGQYAVTGSLRNGNVSFSTLVPLDRIEDAGGVWKLTINEGLGADEDLRIHIPQTEAAAFPIYPAFPEHPYQDDASRIRFVWNTASTSLSTGSGTMISTGNGSSVYGYQPGGPRTVATAHNKSVSGAVIKTPGGDSKGAVTTQMLESESRMNVFTDAEPRELSGLTTAVNGGLEFLASGLEKGGRYAVLGKTEDGPWIESYRFTAVSNAHLHAEAAGEGARSFMIEKDPNNAPFAEGQTLAVVEDTPLEMTLSASDPDEDELDFEIVTPPAKGTLQGSGANWTYTPDENVHGSDQFEFRVNDGAERLAFSEIARVTLDIASVNDRPVAADAEFFTMKNGTIGFKLPGSDGDGDALTYQLLGAPAKGTLRGVAPNLSYKAMGPGQWTFRYTASDGNTVSEPGTITMRVRATNQKPVAQAASVVANMGESTPLPLSATDADHDALTYSITKRPKNGVLTGTPPNVSYQPKPGFRGSDSVSYVANDGGVNSKAAVIGIVVVNPNNKAPVANTLAVSGPVRKPVPVLLGGSDVDGDLLGFRVTTQPTNGKLTGKAPRLVFRPAAGFTGTTTFSYVANDGVVDSTPAVVTVTVGTPVVE